MFIGGTRNDCGDFEKDMKDKDVLMDKFDYLLKSSAIFHAMVIV